MKNYIIFFVLICLFGCRKEVSKSNFSSKNLKDSTVIKPNFKEEKTLQVDTLKVEKTKELDKILITTLRKEINKDSVVKAFIRFDFLNKKNLIKSISSSIVCEENGGNWHIYEDVFSKDKTDKRFIEVSYGYEACGYTQTNFLFFIDKNIVQLITTNESMADGAYGTWTSFEPNFKDNKLVSFSSRIIQVDSDESKPYDDTNEDLVITYSDSIIYKWNFNKWLAEYKSTKGKIFRKEFKKFNEIYKSE